MAPLGAITANEHSIRETIINTFSKELNYFIRGKFFGLKFKVIKITNLMINIDLRRNFKKELHAHLNGSLSEETIKKLNKLKHNDTSGKDLDLNSFKSYSECFNIFGLIHKLTDNLPALHVATYDAIREFYKDGVLYLELRTTPKEIEGCMSRTEYVNTVLSAIQKATELTPNMKVKLLLSIDRKNTSLTAAEEIVKIAEWKLNSTPSIVVGIDLCGDANTDDVLKYIPILQFAKNSGLKLSLHLAEIPDRDAENEKLLQLYPDRIGHGTFLHPKKGGSEKNFEEVKRRKIPLEMCLTSNVACCVVPSYNDHHFPLWREIEHPSTICTDDKGIFNTTLSNEYNLVHKYFGLSPKELYQMSFNSIDYSFANESEKSELCEYWKNEKDNLLSPAKKYDKHC